MSENVKNIVNKIADLTGPGEQSTAFYHLYARIASGLENNEEGSDRTFISMSAAWAEAARNFDKVAKENPALAFEQALTLCLLPRHDNPKREKVLHWMRGDGPIILAKKNLRQPLIKFIKSDPRAPELFVKLQKNMEYDMSKLTQDEALSDAECFLAVASIYLGAKLADIKHQKSITALSNAAKEKLADPQVSKVVEYYSTEPDTAWIVEELRQFLSP